MKGAARQYYCNCETKSSFMPALISARSMHIQSFIVFLRTIRGISGSEQAPDANAAACRQLDQQIDQATDQHGRHTEVEENQ